MHLAPIAQGAHSVVLVLRHKAGLPWPACVSATPPQDKAYANAGCMCTIVHRQGFEIGARAGTARQPTQRMQIGDLCARACDAVHAGGSPRAYAVRDVSDKDCRNVRGQSCKSLGRVCRPCACMQAVSVQGNDCLCAAR